MEKSVEMLIYEMAFKVRLYRMLQETENRVLDLTDREIGLLEILSMKDSMSVSEIASLYPTVSSSTISNSITRLWKEKKLVNKMINPENQRITIVSLNAKGKKIVKEIKTANSALYKTITASLNLSPEEEIIFKSVLNKSIKFFDARLSLFQD
jgi:DNA-binding MarR family transcriptional regulator